MTGNHHSAGWLRRIAKALYLRVLFLSGALRWARARAAARGIVVLTLHRVLCDDEYREFHPLPGMAVRASTFEALLRYFARHCRVVQPNSSEVAGDPANAHSPRVALTFDDGWKDNFEVALPIARKYGVPLTIFICPGIIDSDECFWIEKVNKLWWMAERSGKLDAVRTLPANAESADSLVQSLKRVPAKDREQFIQRLQAAIAPSVNGSGEDNQLLRWPEVEHMANAGVAFGSHTNTHAILTEVSPADAALELAQSRQAIEARLQQCSLFAYPNGDWSEPVRELVEQSGYRAAFINSPGLWERESNPFSIPRVNVWEGNLTDASGGFSRMALEYAVFWKAARATRNSG